MEDLLLKTQKTLHQIPDFREYSTLSLKQWIEQDEYDPGFNVKEFLEHAAPSKIPDVAQLDCKTTEEALTGLETIEGWLKTKEFPSDEDKKYVQLAVNFLKQKIVSKTMDTARKSNSDDDLPSKLTNALYTCL
ncbi:uncharacterized protein LOC130675526 [Microplitis mediator]|uniref:uncharacterized protein LOC130675526 n=1 Tax=Microplitis mediator TaxID=375433 RepID=UPI0025534314|nr:uncharacterized protein LOC130675526 [Microplitis mediator]